MTYIGYVDEVVFSECVHHRSDGVLHQRERLSETAPAPIYTYIPTNNSQQPYTQLIYLHVRQGGYNFIGVS